MAKRKLKRDNGHGLTEDQAHFLLNGFCFDGYQPNHRHPRIGGPLPMDCPFATVEDMHVAWDENKDYLMAQAKPGERPWAFYRFAPEPRLRFPMLYGFGEAGWKRYPIETKGLFDSRPSEQEETEPDYLTRLDLWQPGERAAWESKR